MKFSWSSSNNTNKNPLDQYDTSSIDNQISNADMRIKDAGYAPQNTDRRNWFEKLTNLPQGQNFLFDALELLGRPGQAVMNAVDKKNTMMGLGESLRRGISGDDHVRGSDLLRGTNITNPLAKTIVGTGLEIALDPVSYVPGGVLTKLGGKGAQIAKTALGSAYRGAEKLVPGFGRLSENTLRPAAETAKDGLGYMFNPNYKKDITLTGNKSDYLMNLERDTKNSRRFMKENTMTDLVDTAKMAGGVDTGVDVGRLMEAPLKVELNADKTVSDLIKGKPVSVNQIAGELPDLVGKMNQKILSSPIIKRSIVKKMQQIVNIDKRIAEIEKNQNPTARMLERLDEYSAAKERVTNDLANIRRGIHFNPSETTDSFQLVNPKTSLYRRALGDTSKFIDEVSPRGSFDQVVKPELATTLRPIVTRLLQEGQINVPNVLKGTPEQRELRRLFGDKMQVTYNKKSTTLKIDQKNPDTKYYQLQGAKPVIPESLTDTRKQISKNGLQFNDIQFTNRIQKVEVPRPERVILQDPTVQQAAQKLIGSNDAIRQFAAEKGIDIPALAGYMTHVLAQEEKARRAIGKPLMIDVGSFGKGAPNKSILQKRTLEGSVEDINQRLGRNFFEPNAYFSTGVGQQRLIDYIHAVDFRHKVLSNRDFAVPFEKGMDIGKNIVIDTNNYTFLKDSGDVLDGLKLSDKVGGEYVVTPQVKMILDRYQKINSDEGTKAFVKAFDGLQGLWKKLTLFSPGFHIRNIAGALWNNYAAGMNTYQLGKYTLEAAKEVTEALRGKESEIFREFRSQGLSSTGRVQTEFGSMKEPDKLIRKAVEDRSKGIKGKILQRVNPLNSFELSHEIGDIGDQVSRFALYKFWHDKGLSPKDAAGKVREAQFDYTELTPFEQKARRLIPFYTWSRKNIPYQVKKFIENPTKFQNINKLRLNAQENVGLDESNIPDYMKESFWMPVSGSKGIGKTLSLNLPLADITKLSNPVKLAADSITPLIKTPMELATNYNFFKKKPIEKFAGQEKKYLGGIGIPIKTAYALEQLTGQIGRGASDYLQESSNVDQANKFQTPSLGISSLLKDFDAKKYAKLSKIDQLKKLQDLILYIEQQDGQKPRTVREIKKGLNR